MSPAYTLRKADKACPGATLSGMSTKALPSPYTRDRWTASRMGPLKKTSAAVAGVSRGACGVTTSSSFIVVSSSSLSSKASHFL